MPTATMSKNAKAGPGPKTKSIKKQTPKKPGHPKRQRQMDENKKLKDLQHSVANFVGHLSLYTVLHGFLIYFLAYVVFVADRSQICGPAHVRSHEERCASDSAIARVYESTH